MRTQLGGVALLMTMPNFGNHSLDVHHAVTRKCCTQERKPRCPDKFTQPGVTTLTVMPRFCSRGSRASSCVARFSIAFVTLRRHNKSLVY